MRVAIACWWIAGTRDTLHEPMERKLGGMIAKDLVRKLQAKGHEVACIMPYQDLSGVSNIRKPDLVLPEIRVSLRDEVHQNGTYETQLPGTQVPLFLLGHTGAGVLGYDQWEGTGSIKPFVYASRMMPEALLGLARAGKFGIPDVLHLFDYQFALAAPVIRVTHAAEKDFEKMALVGTISEGAVGFQGDAARDDFELTGLPESENTHEGLECYGKIILLKGMGYCDGGHTILRHVGGAERGITRAGQLTSWFEHIKKGTFAVTSEIDVDEKVYEDMYNAALAQRKAA